MKQYAADRHAQYILQIAIPIASILLIIMIWYFLAILPNWMLWSLTCLILAAVIITSIFLLPMWFGSVSYIISDTHITKRCGIFFIQEQTMRLQALQYSTIIRTPVSEKTGMNFIPLHAYGGMILLAFLKPEDAQEIQKFLQHRVYHTHSKHSEHPEHPPAS